MLPNLIDKTVFLLGGGPSLLGLLEDLENAFPLEQDKTIFAINESIYCTSYTDLLFFRDSTWYIANKKNVDAWTAPVVTTAKSRFYTSNVIVVEMKQSNDFLIREEYIKYGRSAGHIALSLAIALGARRCILLGYDCRLVNGKSHFHDKYSDPLEITYRDYFLPAWEGWGDAARRAGVEVVNVTPGSAIKEFPYRPLREVLSE